MEIKAKINTWDLLKLKNCCTAKETIKKTAYIHGKIFANYVVDKGLVSKIYKQFMTLNSIKINKTHSKMGRRPEQTFL